MSCTAGISLTVEFADGVREAGVQFPDPRLIFAYSVILIDTVRLIEIYTK